MLPIPSLDSLRSHAHAVRLSVAIGASLAIAPLSLARAEEPEHPEHATAESEEHLTAHGEHEKHHRFQLSAFGTGIAAIGGGEASGLGGGGVAFAVAVVPAHLELELAFSVLHASEGIDLPIELYLKVPFHVHPKVHPFIGLGPTIVPLVTPDGTKVGYGGASMVGLDIWLNHTVGIFVEANYNLVYREGILHEVGGTGGMVIGL